MWLANNKTREKAIFDIFRDKYGLAGRFYHKDSPDFIVSKFTFNATPTTALAKAL